MQEPKTKEERTVLAFETLRFYKNLGAVACEAMLIGVDRETFMASVVAAWNDAIRTVTDSIKVLEDEDTALVAAKAVLDAAGKN